MTVFSMLDGSIVIVIAAEVAIVIVTVVVDIIK